MRYVSTRGGCDPVSFTDALLAGLAPDGGLYTPERWPSLAPERFAAFAGAAYADVAAEVVGVFAGEAVAPERLRAICHAAYATFDRPAVAPLVQLDAGTWLLELFHGPTLAFKDVAMQLLARLYDEVLGASGRRLTLVVATSGDTGGAAVDAFAGATHVDLVVLFPEGRISEVQRRFMTTADSANVRCVAVEGDFDACQAVVKALFADATFRDGVDLSGVNSINWARIAAQSVYYVTAASALGRAPAFVVPTGNFGDAFAGYAAHRLGSPVAALGVATNGNDILARAFITGRYARGETTATQSPAMDIQVASNFERLYFELVGREAAVTRAAFEGFARGEAIALPASPELGLFRAGATGEQATAMAIQETWERAGVLVDPHTAVALAAARGMELPAGAPVVVLATAHPAKFPEAVEAATGEPPELHARAADLHTRVERIDRLPADVAAAKAYVRAFAADRRRAA